MENAEIIKVSVVMPIFNAYKYIRPALESIMEQTLREIEIICVDDGSTDRTLDILKEYQSKDSRIRIITENNAGPAAARNKGLSRVRGEYVIFLDADDFFNPQLVEKLYDVATRDQLDIAICRYDIYNGRKAKTEEIDMVAKLFDEIAPKYENRKGGYTRIVKVGPRKGDGAEVVIIELV